MPIYASDHPDVPGMKGLHLFHFVLSNCSQRVRFGLAEKGLAWEGHHLNLPANEHLTGDYQRINPGGVVPTLVHDGQVVIESNDILEYLDDQFPEPALRSPDADECARAERLIARAGEAQPTIKVLSHELVFRPFRKIGPDELALFDAKASDRGLAAFMHDYADNGPAWQARVDAAHPAMRRFLDELETALGRADWLSGAQFGLADISWIVNAHRLTQAQYDLSGWPRLGDWYARVIARPAFDAAVVSWRPE
jgi:glutathione S-transferase